MKTVLLHIRRSLVRIGHILGIFWTKIILGAFYLSIFGLFAIFARLFRHDPLSMHAPQKSTWQTWEKVGLKEDWFRPF